MDVLKERTLEQRASLRIIRNCPRRTTNPLIRGIIYFLYSSKETFILFENCSFIEIKTVRVGIFVLSSIEERLEGRKGRMKYL